MASIDGDDVSVSDSSDLQKARKLYADLQAMSMESTGSTEVRTGTSRKTWEDDLGTLKYKQTF